MGGIDVLVNNAGTSYIRRLGELTDDDWRQQYELHVMAPMRLMRAAAPRMAGRGGGRIVNVCSSSGKRPSQTNPAYSVTKAAQLSLSRVVRRRLRARRGAHQRSLARARSTASSGSRRAAWPSSSRKQRGMTPQEALAQQRDKVPIGRYGTPGRGRRRDRLPVLRSCE